MASIFSSSLYKMPKHKGHLSIELVSSDAHQKHDLHITNAGLHLVRFESVNAELALLLEFDCFNMIFNLQKESSDLSFSQ